MHTTKALSSMMVKAFSTTSCGRVRLYAPGLRFVTMPRTAMSSVNIVLVLIPPPVDPGDAPMNIKRVSTNSPADVNDPIA